MDNPQEMTADQLRELLGECFAGERERPAEIGRNRLARRRHRQAIAKAEEIIAAHEGEFPDLEELAALLKLASGRILIRLGRTRGNRWTGKRKAKEQGE